MHRPTRSLFLLAPLLVSTAASAQNATPRVMTLQDALASAYESNAGLRAVRQTVEQAQRQSRVTYSYYLPRLSTQAAFLGSDNTRGIIVPQGALGAIPGLGAFPPASTTIPQGGSNIVFAFTSAQQPLTQYFKIREGVAVNRADEDISRAGLRRTEQAVSVGVLKAYAGVLIATKRRDVARERVNAATQRTATQTLAVQTGLATDIASVEARLRGLQARQDVMDADAEIADLTYALADAIGIPGSTPLTVEAPPPIMDPIDSLDVYVSAALRSNPDILEAGATVNKATHGVAAAKTSYIPDIGLFGGQFYQSSFPFLPHSTLIFGAVGNMTWLDFGARRNTLAEREAQQNAANRNLERVKGQVRGAVEAAYRKVMRSYEVVTVAREALALRTEALRLRTAQTTAGYGVQADQTQASADRLEGELDVLRAEMGYRIARAELDQAAGRLAR